MRPRRHHEARSFTRYLPAVVYRYYCPLLLTVLTFVTFSSNPAEAKAIKSPPPKPLPPKPLSPPLPPSVVIVTSGPFGTTDACSSWSDASSYSTYGALSGIRISHGNWGPNSNLATPGGIQGLYGSNATAGTNHYAGGVNSNVAS